MAKASLLVPLERVESRILLIRGEKVLFDSDLASLYGVETRVLIQAVKRNLARFPDDFVFQLTPEEYEAWLKSQSVISNGRGGRRSRPYVFTEHGALMAATVLNSTRAVEMSVYVVRAFVRLRRLIASHAHLARKLAQMERKYDHQFKVVFDAIRQLMEPPPEPRRKRIGFVSED